MEAVWGGRGYVWENQGLIQSEPELSLRISQYWSEYWWALPRNVSRTGDQDPERLEIIISK